MRKVKLLCDINGGLQKAGWGVELSDETAAQLVSAGKATYLPEGAALKKGNLDLYNGCTPLSPGKIAANQAAIRAKIDEQTNTNTIK
jgi:hypothetical protein